jgi:hypothetical protein
VECEVALLRRSPLRLPICLASLFFNAIACSKWKALIGAVSPTHIPRAEKPDLIPLEIRQIKRAPTVFFCDQRIKRIKTCR